MRSVTKILLAVAFFALPLAALESAEAINVAASANGGVASHTRTCFGAPASRANDGNTNGSFFSGASVSHTCNDPESPTGSGLFDFWEVDLGGDDHAIDRIIVYNRTDCCADRIDPFRVTLFDGASVEFSQDVAAFVADITAPNVSGMTFDLSGQIGDRVRIQLTHRNFLHLAEVEVFDQAIAPPVPLPATAILVAGGMVTLAALRGRKLFKRR